MNKRNNYPQKLLNDFLQPGHIIVLQETVSFLNHTISTDEIGLILGIEPDVDLGGHNHIGSYYFDVLYPFEKDDRYKIHWLRVDVHKSLEMNNFNVDDCIKQLKKENGWD